jgi:hypothetical protein
MTQMSRKGTAVVQFSLVSLTKSETRYVTFDSIFASSLQHEFRLYCVRWVTQNLRPLAIVEDYPFLAIAKGGRPKYWIPSAKTVGRDIRRVYWLTMAHIKKFFSVSILLVSSGLPYPTPCPDS